MMSNLMIGFFLPSSCSAALLVLFALRAGAGARLQSIVARFARRFFSPLRTSKRYRRAGPERREHQTQFHPLNACKCILRLARSCGARSWSGAAFNQDKLREADKIGNRMSFWHVYCINSGITSAQSRR